MHDHQDILLEIAGRVANALLKGESVRFGAQPYDFYTMNDVYEFMLSSDDLEPRKRDIDLQFMYAVGNADNTVAPQIAHDELMLDAIGAFAESVAWRVDSYHKTEAADDMAARVLEGNV